jgi:hypothetical protein
MPLPELLDYDTLLFAPALAACGGGVRPVVDELLAAANTPDRLQGIDPTVIRVRAADLLSLEHDPALLDDAVAILRGAVAQALPDELGLAQDALAKTLAEQGNLPELDAMARELLQQPPTLPWAQLLASMSSVAAIFGYGRQAVGWLDQALAAAAGRGSPLGRAGRADQAIRPTLADAKQRLAGVRAAMTAEGCDPDDPAAARERMRTRPTAAATVGSYPAWPADFQGRLVWWPETEYVRVTRQLPELGAILGSPWRGHTGRVQAAMTGTVRPDSELAAGRAERPNSLVAADFGQFAQFLEWSRADPLAPPSMTAFGALATRLPDPVRWPPKDRAPCWCGSGVRYRDCCARRGAAD